MSLFEIPICPADDPTGTPTATLTEADVSALKISISLNDLGEVRVTLPRNRWQSLALDMRESYYGRVKVPHIDADSYVQGFWLIAGEMILVSEQERGGEDITIGGPGPAWILTRAVLNHEEWTDHTGVYVQDGTWYFSGKSFGDILTILLGEDAASNHPALDGMESIGWNSTQDVDGNVWQQFGGIFSQPVGTSFFDVIRQLQRSGEFEWWVTPNLNMRAFSGTYGRDLSGTSYGTGVVRFVGSDVTPDENHNIIGNLTRRKDSGGSLTHVLVLGNDRRENGHIIEGSPIHRWAADPDWSTGEYVREGYMQYDTNSTDILIRAGLRLIERSKDRSGRMASFETMPGRDEDEGLYLPGAPGTDRGNYWIGDTITIKTGGAEGIDFLNRDLRIAKVRLELDQAAKDDTLETRDRSWHTFIETGDDLAPTNSASSAKNENNRGGGCMHCLGLCVPREDSLTVDRYYFGTSSAGLPTVAIDAAWEHGNAEAGMSWKKGHLLSTPDAANTTNSWGIGSGGALDDRIAGQQFSELSGSGTLSGFVRGIWRVRRRTGVGVSSNQQHQTQCVIRIVSADGSTVRGTLLAAHQPASLTDTKFGSSYSSRLIPAFGQWAGVDGAALTPVAYQDGDWLVVELGSRTITNATGNGANFSWTSDSTKDDLTGAEGETASNNGWLELVVAGGEENDGAPLDTVHQGEETHGTDNRATRCDHQHAHGLLSADGTDYHDWSDIGNNPVHADAAPTITDDEDAGFTTGTIWIDDSTGDIYILVDATAGAAVWEQVNGAGVTDHGALTGLADDDHTQYILKSLVDAKGDILAGTGADTISRLGVGSDGQILSADSSQSTGLIWIDAPSESGGGTGSGEILISDTPSTPLIFADLLQNEDQNDLLYAEPGEGGGGGVTDHGSLTGLGDVDHNYVRGDSGENYRMVAGVVRKLAGVWTLLDDATHIPIGISGISSDADSVDLTFSFTATKVGAVIVGADETWAELYHFGPSVTTTEARVGITDMDGNAVAPTAVASSSSANFWFIGLMEV